jgi:hypothetical protein
MTRTARLPGFRITGKKGFHITFANGWTVSVQFGPGNYCEHYDRNISQDAEECGEQGSGDAETAVWGPTGEMVDRGNGDTVQARQTPAQVLELLTWAAAQ